MYQSISDNENSWDESTKEEADGGEADEGSVSSRRLWKVGTGCLQQTAGTSSDIVELVSCRDEPQTPNKSNGQDSANSEGLMGDSSDCLDSDSLEIRPNEEFPRNEEETEHLQFHPQPKLYPTSHPPLHHLSNQRLGLSAAFETWTHDDDDDDNEEMVNEINHTTTTMSDKGKPTAAYYDNEAKTTTVNERSASSEELSAEKFREGDETTPSRQLDSSSLLRCKEIERRRTEHPNRNNLLQQIRRIPSKVFSKIRRKDEDKIQMELPINKELGLHLTLTEKANNPMASPDYGKSHRNGEGGDRKEWDAEDCDFENKTLRNQANTLNSNPKLDPKSRWKSGTRGPKDCHSSRCENDVDRDFQKSCSSFSSNCSVVKTPDSFPQRKREPIDKYTEDFAESSKRVFSRILRCRKQQQQQQRRRRQRRLDDCNSSRDSCDAMAFAGDSKSELRDDFKVKKSILDGKRRVQGNLRSPGIRRRKRSSRERDATCTESRALDAERNDSCPGSTMIQTVLTDADGSPNVRMVGEIAAQLERRILLYVFSGTDRKSDYGIQVRNIPDAIEETCLDRNTGKVNISLRFRLIKRCAFIETSVRPFGYRFDFHPQLAIVLLSKYGRVDHSTLKSKFFVSPVDAEARQDVIQLIDCACPPNERDHVIVLFNCLLLLSSDDGKSVFIWND